MINTTYYKSPLGDILLASKNNMLIGAWFEGQKYYLSNISQNLIEKEDRILIKTKKWLDSYFGGEKPPIDELSLRPQGSNFRLEVWKLLCEIPYGQTASYKDIASKIAENRGIEKMSAQAVGGAVGHNPISIIIPCHRVIGSDGALTGYAGGIDRKLFLLKHENARF
ncbi:methylated-DNA--[protein]-cysteine S-methyltransferase [Methanobrevibacter sp.]|uniref:methylated-DNA--[protein]-cysteine S-methyltransferase n=1 Tax=Methanobrevibacter sp. TaxID=66852 RepID=UPI00388E97FE